MLYGLKRNAELNTPAFVYGATETGPHDVINLPNYQQVEDVKNVIDGTAGKVIAIDGIKYLPEFRTELVSDEQLTAGQFTHNNSPTFINDNWFFWKMYNQGAMVLFNRLTNECWRLTTGNASFNTFVSPMAGPAMTGYFNAKNNMIQDGNRLLFPTLQSGGSWWIAQIDTSRIPRNEGYMSVNAQYYYG